MISRLALLVLIPPLLVLILLLFFLLPDAAEASPCNSGPINPVTDVSWRCIFPIQIAGIVQLGGDAEDPDDIDNPICVCTGGLLPKFGLTVSFWEPSSKPTSCVRICMFVYRRETMHCSRRCIATMTRLILKRK